MIQCCNKATTRKKPSNPYNLVEQDIWNDDNLTETKNKAYSTAKVTIDWWCKVEKWEITKMITIL